MNTITAKQHSYLMSLAKARYWSDVVTAAKKAGVRLTMRERDGQITAARASELIDALKAAA